MRMGHQQQILLFLLPTPFPKTYHLLPISATSESLSLEKGYSRQDYPKILHLGWPCNNLILLLFRLLCSKKRHILLYLIRKTCPFFLLKFQTYALVTQNYCDSILFLVPFPKEKRTCTNSFAFEHSF